MKKFVICLFCLFISPMVKAATETINWYVDGNTYATTTCQTGGDITLPPAPTKYGHTFQGWAGYEFLEYIESTGTQYIDTGVKVGSDTETEFTGKFTSLTNAYQLFGVDDNTPKVNQVGVNNNNKWFLTFGGSSGVATAATADTNQHTFVVKKDDNGYGALFIDGTQRLTHTASVFVADDSYHIFGRYYKNNPSNDCLTNFQLKNFKFIQNGTVIMNLVPCKDPNGVVGMYDTVTDTFFTNAGTGEFIAGPVINQ